MIAASPGTNTRQGLQPSLRAEIEGVLRAFNGLGSVKKLFWELLGYERRDETISVSELNPAIRSTIFDARLFASHDGFHLYYLTVTSDHLNPQTLRGLYRSFRRKHRLVALILSNAAQTDWHFCYQPDDLAVAGSRGRLATIRLGHGEEHLRRQSQALHRVRTYDDNDESLSLVELAAAYDNVFITSMPKSDSTIRPKYGVELLLSEIARYPLLTVRQERAILEELESIAPRQCVLHGNRSKTVRVPREGCERRFNELRDLLVVHNLRLCFYLSKRFAINQEEILDLFQESVLVLFRAIDLFENHRDMRFSTYAALLVRRVIINWIILNRALIPLPLHVRGVRRKEHSRPKIISLSDSYHDDAMELIDHSTQSASTDREVLERDLLLGLSLQRLPDRYASVLIRRFGLYGVRKQSVSEIGESMELTERTVQRIEAKALQKLRIYLNPVRVSMD